MTARRPKSGRASFSGMQRLLALIACHHGGFTADSSVEFMLVSDWRSLVLAFTHVTGPAACQDSIPGKCETTAAKLVSDFRCWCVMPDSGVFHNPKTQNSGEVKAGIGAERQGNAQDRARMYSERSKDLCQIRRGVSLSKASPVRDELTTVPFEV